MDQQLTTRDICHIYKHPLSILIHLKYQDKDGCSRNGFLFFLYFSNIIKSKLHLANSLTSDLFLDCRGCLLHMKVGAVVKIPLEAVKIILKMKKCSFRLSREDSHLLEDRQIVTKNEEGKNDEEGMKYIGGEEVYVDYGDIKIVWNCLMNSYFAYAKHTWTRRYINKDQHPQLEHPSSLLNAELRNLSTSTLQDTLGDFLTNKSKFVDYLLKKGIVSIVNDEMKLFDDRNVVKITKRSSILSFHPTQTFKLTSHLISQLERLSNLKFVHLNVDQSDSNFILRHQDEESDDFGEDTIQLEGLTNLNGLRIDIRNEHQNNQSLVNSFSTLSALSQMRVLDLSFPLEIVGFETIIFSLFSELITL